MYMYVYIYIYIYAWVSLQVAGVPASGAQREGLPRVVPGAHRGHRAELVRDLGLPDVRPGVGAAAVLARELLLDRDGQRVRPPRVAVDVLEVRGGQHLHALRVEVARAPEGDPDAADRLPPRRGRARPAREHRRHVHERVRVGGRGGGGGAHRRRRGAGEAEGSPQQPPRQSHRGSPGRAAGPRLCAALPLEGRWEGAGLPRDCSRSQPRRALAPPCTLLESSQLNMPRYLQLRAHASIFGCGM